MHSNKLSMLHPGRIILEEFLAPAVSASFASPEISTFRPRRIYEIVQGQRSINADIAHRLAHYFGMSERYWLDLQARYDSAIESDRYRPRVGRCCLAVAK